MILHTNMGNTSMKVVSENPLKINIRYLDHANDKQETQQVITLVNCDPKQQGEKLILTYKDGEVKTFTYENKKEACSAYNELLKILGRK